MDVSFIKNRPFFPTTLGESVSEDFNYMLPLESTCLIVVTLLVATLPDPIPHSTILPTNQVP